MLDALEKLAQEAAVLDHNETDRWYNADELMADWVSAKDAIWYPKNARLMAACDPATMLKMIAAIRAAKRVVDSNEGDFIGFFIKVDDMRDALAALEDSYADRT
jgi:hypothetical protein